MGASIPFLIMGGTSLLSAGVQSHQASNAANAEKQAAQQGINLLGNIYQGTRQNLAPYQALGTSSLSNLYRMTGQTPPSPSVQALQNQPMPSGYTPQQQQLIGAQQQIVANAPNGGTAIGRLMNSYPALQQQFGGSGSTVMLRAPDGTTKAVPSDQAQFYLSRGATRVS